MPSNKENKAKAERRAGVLTAKSEGCLNAAPAKVHSPFLNATPAEGPVSNPEKQDSHKDGRIHDGPPSVRIAEAAKTKTDSTPIDPKATDHMHDMPTVETQGIPSANPTVNSPSDVVARVKEEVGRLGYFDPDFPAPAESRDPVRTTSREYIYRDVFAFIERLRATASTRGLEQLRTILPRCFRNSASTWYNEELEDHERDLLSSEESDFENWHGALTARFGANGQRLARAPVINAELVDQSKSKKLKRKKSSLWNQRKGEELDEWQKRIGLREG